MKMNDTVARIVEIMFQDVEINEETAAIRDEVMNNCQERYVDLVNSGMAEDDAIAAVIESLKGMDDVLSPYKQKAQHVSNDSADELGGEMHRAFSADQVHAIDVQLINEDVTIEPSDDDSYHVIWDTNDNPMINAELHNGIIRIARMPGDAVKIKADGQVEHHHKDGMDDFVRTEKGKIEINLDSIDGMLKSIGEKLKNTFSNLHVKVGFGDSAVKLQVPENAIPHVKILTTSGDIDIQNVALTDLHVTSTSGDVQVSMGADQNLESLEMRTTSGDVDVSAYAERMTVSSTSGDVEVEGRANTLTVNTISGDIDVRADVSCVNFKAISGDVDLVFDSNNLRTVNGSTISGDIDIDLPEGIGFMSIHTQTRSGDVTTCCHTNGVGPAVGGSVTSMSGDITIR